MNAAVLYSRMNGTQHTNLMTTRHPQRMNSTRSTTSGSLRFSRSTNTSIKSNTNSSRDRAIANEQYPENLVQRQNTERPASDPNASAHNNRRDIFNCTLNIPTTINEETTRSSFSHSLNLDRIVFKAVLELAEHDINSGCSEPKNVPCTHIPGLSSQPEEITKENTTDQPETNTTDLAAAVDTVALPVVKDEEHLSSDDCDDYNECETLLVPAVISDSTCEHFGNHDELIETTSIQFSVYPPEIVMQQFQCLECIDEVED